MSEFGNITLNKEWRFEVRSTVGSGAWTRVQAMRNFVPGVEDNVVDASTYDGEEWGSDAIVGRRFRLSGSLLRRNNATNYDPGQDILRAASDSLDVIEARWYQPNLATGLAYQGQILVQWNPDGGEAQGLQLVSFTCLGQGERVAITMPTPTTAPLITSILEGGATPSLAVAGGDLVEIYGTSFLGATAVTFGAAAATSFNVASNTLIVAVSPANAAGSISVDVTTPAGSSNGFDVTYA